MSVVLDTTVLIDSLRGDEHAVSWLLTLDDRPWCSEVTRVEEPKRPDLGISCFVSSACGSHAWMWRMDGGMHRDFRAFFEAESDALLRLCWAVTLDREQARDVAQETMARAWRDWDRLGRPLTDSGAGKGGGAGVEAGGLEDLPSPAAWCRTVALNLIRSQWRRERTARNAQLRPPDPVGLGATDLDVRDALEHLSARQREAVVLHHMLDLSVARCAEIMGVGEPSVKTHLQRGRDALQKQLTNHLIESREA